MPAIRLCHQKANRESVSLRDMVSRIHKILVAPTKCKTGVIA
jgi:hypothetical protein